jgi:glutathione S-transferase
VLDIEEAVGIIDDFDRARFPAFYMNRRPDMFGLPSGWNQSEEGKTILKNLHDKVLTEAIPTFAKHITDKLERNGGTWLASTDGPTLADCLAVPFLRSFTNGYMGPLIPPDCLDKYPKFVQYIKRFCALPEIKGRYSTGVY